jgi:hypothetical protein
LPVQSQSIDVHYELNRYADLYQPITPVFSPSCNNYP